ncbi:hypothetical protein CIB48_g11714 [Xylaria polymorpha]|nr:hypothetical protein CIB48_g11714 [Xylaria polymorpha]
MDKAEEDKRLSSPGEQIQGNPQTNDFAEIEKIEKTHNNHDTDTDVDSSSISTATSVASSQQIEQQQQQQPGSRPLSRAVSESEVRDGFQNQRDPELGPELTEKVDTTAPNPDDPNLVTWTGPDDEENPKNWKFSKKWAAVFTVSLFTLISPISSSLVAPALEAIADELKITQAFEKNLTLSIFILAYAVGPLVWGPLSEIYGRVVVLQLVNLIYLFFNLGCGLARTKEQLIAFRFLAGLGGSAPLAIGGGFPRSREA